MHDTFPFKFATATNSYEKIKCVYFILHRQLDEKIPGSSNEHTPHCCSCVSSAVFRSLSRSLSLI